MIPVSFSLFVCFFVFTKIISLLSFFYSFFFFMKIIFIFSCSGMLRNVPECSVFRILSTPSLAVALLRSVHA